MRNNIVKICMTFVLLLVVLFPFDNVMASTMWSANGFWVENGGSLAAINVDDYNGANPSLKLVTVGSGYRYIGLLTEGTLAGLKAGLNEAGLFVSATPIRSTSVDEVRQAKRMNENLDKILTNCSTADEVAIAALSGNFWGSQALLATDKNCTILIEIMPNGYAKTEKRINNALWQTDHYAIYSLLNYNNNISKSSDVRYTRINTLLNAEINRPLTWQSFMAFVNDKIDGPDNSLWRQGSTESGLRTVASMIVYLPTQGMPKVYVQKYAGSNTEVNSLLTDEFNMEDVFRGIRKL